MKTQWKSSVAIVSIGFLISACGPPAPEQTAEPPAPPPQAAQPSYEIVNIEGNFYQAGVRGMGGHTTVFVVTPDARCDSGQLDVCETTPLRLGRELAG